MEGAGIMDYTKAKAFAIKYNLNKEQINEFVEILRELQTEVIKEGYKTNIAAIQKRLG